MRRGLLAFALGLALAGQAAAQQAAPIGVRGWDHGDYGRLVFDLGAKVDGKAVLDGLDLVVTFSEPVTVDAVAALRRLGRLAGPVTLAPDGKSLRITLKQPVTLVPQRYQDKLVLDLKPGSEPSKPVPEAAKPEAPKPEAPKPDTPKPEAAKPVAPKPEAAKPEASKPEPAKPVPARPEVAAPVPAPTPVAPAAAPPTRVAEAGHAPAAPSATAPHGTENAQHGEAPSPSPAQPPVVAPAGPAASIALQRNLSGAVAQITFAAPTAAAVFARGDTLWFIFDRPGADASRLAASPLSELGTIEPLDVPGGSGFRLVGRQVPPQVGGDGTSWQFLFTPEARPPAQPVAVSPGSDGQGRMRLTARVPGVAAPMSLTDPDIGDGLTVVPMANAGNGVAVGGRLPDLELLPTAQGLAFIPLADDVTASVQGDDLAITRDGSGLTLSEVLPPPSSAPRGLAERPDTGLDVNAWVRPGDTETVRSELEREAAMASGGSRNARRLALGRFLVVNGYSAEAIGVAEMVMKDDPEEAQMPSFRLLRGIALSMQERHAEALANLAQPSLEFVPDAALWRGYSRAATGDKRTAYKDFGGGVSVLGRYPARYQERLLAAIGDAALTADDVRGASEAAASLSTRATTAAGKARALALEGRVAVRRSDAVAARAAFEKALASGERVARVDAELGLVELGLADGSLSRADAIARLDRLRYAWRGDGKELAVLRRLADLELAEGRWRDGLDTLRAAERLFPKDAGVETLKETERAAFRRLFLGGGADAMPPVQAVALYFDYRDLTPIGPDGDEMIRKLADRLVRVDLLDQAKNLLAHQVDNRLQGIPRARVAARLALLHLIDHEPEKARQVLDRTEQPVLPEGTARLRRLLRAQSLADVGQTGSAKALLGADDSADAARLGAEITWKARDWPGAVLYLGRLLGLRTPPAHGAPEAEDEALVLRLAVARTLAGDAAGLKQLADQWGGAMAQSKSADAFAMLAGGADPSAISTRNLAQTMANGSGGGGSFLSELRRRMIAGELALVD